MELCTLKQISSSNIVQVLARPAAAIAEQSVQRQRRIVRVLLSPVESSGEVRVKRGSEPWIQQTSPYAAQRIRRKSGGSLTGTYNLYHGNPTRAHRLPPTDKRHLLLFYTNRNVPRWFDLLFRVVFITFKWKRKGAK